jgi:membrane associated rhomboid family serine protease
MFFFPISDDNHSTIRPYVSYCIIALCCFIFLWQSTLPTNLYKDAIYNFGIVPVALLGDQPGFINPYLTIFTSMFMHGSWMHLLGNMVFLWIFGDNIEDSMGHKKFLLFYLLCGLLAAFLQALIDPSSTTPMIGASGAIAGILGAYLVLHPKANVNVLLWIIIFITVIKVPAFLVLSAWIILQFFSASFGSGAGVAYYAHIGGFLAGGCLIYFFKHPHIALFQPGNSRSFQSNKFNINAVLNLKKERDFMQEFIDTAEKKDKN